MRAAALPGAERCLCYTAPRCFLPAGRAAPHQAAPAPFAWYSLRLQLRAVLTAVQPAELVLPKGQLSRECRKVAAGILRGHRTNELPPGPGEGQVRLVERKGAGLLGRLGLMHAVDAA